MTDASLRLRTEDSMTNSPSSEAMERPYKIAAFLQGYRVVGEGTWHGDFDRIADAVAFCDEINRRAAADLPRTADDVRAALNQTKGAGE